MEVSKHPLDLPTPSLVLAMNWIQTTFPMTLECQENVFKGIENTVRTDKAIHRQLWS